MPPGATDCHMHVFGPASRYPWAARRLYTPPDASVAQYRAMCRMVGLDRVVLVQPSVYASDNAAMLDAMHEIGTARCRGIAAIGAETPDHALQRMHAAGIRGARLSITAMPLTEAERAGAAVLELGRRIAPLGWHLQLIARIAMIGALAKHLRGLPVPPVIDHMGLPSAHLGLRQEGFPALLDLLRDGSCWVKLSGGYRVVAEGAPPAGATPFARALAEANPRQVVWGSDWPHPGHAPGRHAGPADGHFEDLDAGALLDLLADAGADAAARRAVLVDNPARLYGFDPE
jgi:predicted TIM-barrel fold metal-dependent hydrolase